MKWRVQSKQALVMLRYACDFAAACVTKLRDPQVRREWRKALSERRPSWSELRQRAGITFWVNVLGFVLFTTFIWLYDPIGNAWTKALLCLGYAVVPFSTLLEQKDARASRRFDWWHPVFVLVNLFFVVIAISDRLDRPLLGLNAFLLLISALALLVFGDLVRRTPLLGVALVPFAVILEVLLVVMWSSESVRLEYVLIPLPTVLVITVIWMIGARFLLTHARQRRQSAVWGPATESITMVFMFLPLALLAVVVPIAVSNDRTWLAVSIAIIGVSFGAVVSVPLRQFLLDLGQLPPIRRWEGATDEGPHELRGG